MLFKNKQYYIDKIAGFVINMTSYQGEWCRGYNHKYQILISDVIPSFIIFEIQENNGEMRFMGYDKNTPEIHYAYFDNPEERLTKKQFRKIYKILKGIDIFHISRLKID